MKQAMKEKDFEDFDDEMMTEQELCGLITKKLKTRSNFLDLLKWIDKFYNAYIHFGEKTGHMTDGIKKEAKIARGYIRRYLLQQHLLLCAYRIQGDIKKETTCDN